MKTKTYLPHFNCDLRITGPYLNKVQNRRFVTITNVITNKKSQKTYAKYLMEIHLGRELSKKETVDHIDRNKLNDVIGNLQILSPSEHSILDNKRAINLTISCAWCGTNIITSARKLRAQHIQKCAGPFCGAVCRGKYGASISHGGKKITYSMSH